MPNPTHLALETLQGAVVGGVIGYATNRLAIWMLFHPRQPLKVLGLQLPLTPGLVMKNRDRLAEAVGRSVAHDLLAPEVIMDQIRASRPGRMAAELLEAELARLAADPRPLGEAVALPGAIASSVAGAVAEWQASDKPMGLAEELIPPLEQWVPARALSPGAIDTLAGQLASMLAGAAAAESTGATLGGALVTALADPELEGRLQGALEATIAREVPRLRPALMEALGQYLDSEAFAEIGRARLTLRIYEMIVGRFPMARVMVSERRIGEMIDGEWPNIVAELKEIAEASTFADVLFSHLQGQAGKLGGEVLSNLRGQLSTKDLQATIGARLAGSLAQLMAQPATAATIRAALEDWAGRPLGKSLGAGGAAALRRGVAATLAGILAGPELGRRIAAAMTAGVEATPLGRLAGAISPADRAALAGRVGDWVEERLLARLPGFLAEHLPVDRLVAQRVADFEAAELEATINRVSGRELRGIIRLGGLIGIVVGALAQLGTALLR